MVHVLSPLFWGVLMPAVLIAYTALMLGALLAGIGWMVVLIMRVVAW